jgi:hypothetical protein
MTQSDDHNLPEELREVAERLRAARPTLSELERDQLKLRAMASVKRDQAPVVGRSRRIPIRSRFMALAFATLLLGGTAAGGIAASGTSTSGSAAKVQYCPHSTHFPPCK